MQSRDSKDKNSFSKIEKEKINRLNSEKEERIKEIKEIDDKICAIQNSTRTLMPQMSRWHNYCCMNSRWYYNWHLSPHTSKAHWLALAVYTMGIILGTVFIASAQTTQVTQETKDYSKIYQSVKQGATEIISKRTQNTKVFDNHDGTEQYIVSSGLFHYKDGESWKEIDTDIASTTGDADFEMAKSIYKAKFKKKFDAQKLVKVSKDGEGFSVSYGNLAWTNAAGDEQIISAPQAVEGQASGNRLEFNGAYGQDLNLSYETDDSSLKKRLIIPALGEIMPTPTPTTTPEVVPVETPSPTPSEMVSPTPSETPSPTSTPTPSPETLPAVLGEIAAPNEDILAGVEPSLTLNMEYELDRDMDILIDGELWNRRKISTQAKNIEFQKDGKTVWGFSPPKTWDSTYSDSVIASPEGAKQSIIDGTLTLTGSGKKLNLNISFPYSWLKTAQYPVTIDPDTYYGETTDGEIYGNDASYSTARNTSFGFLPGGIDFFAVGQYFLSPNYCVRRSYLEFDTSGIDDGATVTQTNLYLTSSFDASQTDFTVRVHKYDWASPIGAGNREANYDGALASTYDADWRSTLGMSTYVSYPSSNLDTTWVKKLAGQMTRYVLLSDRDINATTPTHREDISIASQERATQAYRPYLSITVLPAGPHYWVADGAGTHNWNDTANWSLTSGGAGGESVPVAGDTAIFDNAGGTHNGALTIDTAVDVATLTFDTNYTGTITQGANTITTATAMSLTGQSLTAGAAITASGTLTIASGKTLDMAGNNLTVTSTFSNSGTLKLTGGETTVSVTNDTDSGTVWYYGTSGPYTIKNLTYFNLKIDGAATTFNQQAAANTVNGAFDVTAGIYSQGANQNLTVKGNFTIAATGATFTKGTGTSTLILDGTPSAGIFTGPATPQNLGAVQIGTSPGTTDLAADFAADSLTINAGDIFNTNGYEVDIGSGGITLATGAPGGTLDTTDDVETDGTIITDAGALTINSGAVFTKDVTGTRSTVKMDGGITANLTSSSQDLGDFQTSVASTHVDLVDALTVDGMTIDGSTILDDSGGNYAITVSENWANSGTFTAGTSTVTFDAGDSGNTIADGGSNWNNVIFNNGSGGWSFSDSTIISGDLTVTAGTLSGASDITVNGGDATGNGTITLTGGIFLLDTEGNFGGDAAWTFSSLTFGNGAGATTSTKTGTGAITVSSVLTIAAEQILNAGDDTWTLSGSGTPFVKTGTLTPGTSTFQYTAAADVTVAAANYFHLDLIDPPAPQSGEIRNPKSLPADASHQAMQASETLNKSENSRPETDQPLAENDSNNELISYTNQLLGIENINSVIASERKQSSSFVSSLKPGATEIVSKRTQNQKVFRNPDGTEQYIIGSGPIHYKKNNQWQDIDTNIQVATNGSVFEMLESIYQAQFNKFFQQDKIVKIEKDGYGVSVIPGDLSWNNGVSAQLISNPKDVPGEATGNKVTYSDAYGQGLDFSYQTNDTKLTKNLLIPSLDSLPKPSDENTNLSLNLGFELDKEMDIYIGDEKWDGKETEVKGKDIEFQKDGKTVWGFSPPKAWDSQGEEKGIDGTLTISATGKKLNLNISFPYSWLKTAQYPVIIDPDTYYGATTDGYIYGESNNTYTAARSTSSVYNTTYTYFFLGQYYDAGGGFPPMPPTWRVYRDYIEFDTSSIDDGATVSQVNLYLTALVDMSYTDFNVRVHKYDWTSPIDAGNREANYDGALVSTYDADWRNTLNMLLNTPYASSNLDTTWVKKLAGQMTRYSLLSDRDVSATEPTINEYIYLHAQEAATQAYRPYLSITVAAPPVYTLSSGTFDIDGNLTIGNSVDTMSVTANTNDPTIDLEGNMSITANSTFVASNSAAFTVGGSWSNAGIFTHSSGTITFNTTASSTITGSTTFNNLVMNTTTDGAKTIIFPTGSANKQVISGTWTLDGAVGNVLTLQSATPTTAWYFQIAAPFTSGDYINVTDSWSADANKITAGTNVTNGGNNDGWLFNQTPTNVSLTFTNPLGGAGNTAVADDTTEWNFQAVVSDTDGYTNLNYTEIRFANATDSILPYDSLKFRWTEGGLPNPFSEVADTQTAAAITSVVGDASCAANQCTLDFKIQFNNNFTTKDTQYNIELYTIDEAAASDDDDYALKYQVTALSLTFDITPGDTVAFGNLTPGTPIDALATGTIASVTTNSANGYTIGLHDSVAGSDSALLHTDAATRITDYAGTIAVPTLWTGTGLGITLYAADTNKEAKWGTGITYNDALNKYAGIPQASTVAHTVTGYHAGADTSSWAYSVDVPNTQKTGAYSGNMTFTATAVLL